MSEPVAVTVWSKNGRKPDRTGPLNTNCMPPLSSHNRFSTLSVDNIPEIDEPVANSQVVQSLERPPEGVPFQRRVWRPRWEQCLLAQFIVDVLDETEGPWRSLRLNIELQTTDTGETRAVKALLDSGATGMFIAYVCYNFKRFRQSSTVVGSKVQDQMSLEECKS